MLNFPDKPDPVFAAIVDVSLELRLAAFRDLVEEGYADEAEWRKISWAGKVFTPQTAADALEALLDAHRDSERVYGLTDYHWLIVFDALDAYCDYHNDVVADDGPQPIGPYLVGRIAWDVVIDAYLWDLDFITGEPLINMPENVRRMMRFSPEAFGIAAGLAPHRDELRLVEREPDPTWEWEHGYPASGLVPVYPRYVAEEEGDDADV